MQSISIEYNKMSEDKIKKPVKRSLADDDDVDNVVSKKKKSSISDDGETKCANSNNKRHTLGDGDDAASNISKKKKPGASVKPSPEHKTSVAAPQTRNRGPSDEYRRFSLRILTESELRSLDYPRPDPNGQTGYIKLFGEHFGFQEGRCKRCDKPFDVTFTRRTQCDFHTEKSLRYGGRQHPHGCCGKGLGSKGCRIAPSHIYQGNLYLDLKGYRRTETRAPPKNENYAVYALDTESVHTKKGLEVCKVSVIDTKLNVVYDQFCQPTSEIIDYNTIWSGIKAKDLVGVTKTFEELRDDLLELFSADTIIVGHGVSHDLISLKIIHDKIVDTLILYPHRLGLPRKRSLKDIALSELGVSIQTGEGHDSEEDAKIAMRAALRKV